MSAGSNPFWDLPADERAAAMDRAAEQGGVQNFFDLDPDQRNAAYDQAVSGAWDRER